MNKMPGILPFLLMFGLNGFCQQTAVTTASAQIVNPVGISLEMGILNLDEDKILYKPVVENGWQMIQASFVNTHPSGFAKHLHIANLKIEGDNSGTYGLLFPNYIILKNSRQDYLVMHCYAIKKQRLNETDGIVMIDAAIAIQSNQSLGKYVSDKPITIMVSYD